MKKKITYPYVIKKLSELTCKAHNDNKKSCNYVDSSLYDYNVRQDVKEYMEELGYTIKFYITETYSKVEITW